MRWTLSTWIQLFFGVIGILEVYGSLDQTIAFCQHYVECASVAKLEERLCLGNSLNMPYWLPPKSNLDARNLNCYKFLRPFYRKLDELESMLDEEMVACMSEHALPSSNEAAKCNIHNLDHAKKFSTGRTINYIPTSCFQGKLRIERECGYLRSCCTSYNSCSFLQEESETSQAIKDLKDMIKKLAKDCELGLEIRFSVDDEDYVELTDHQPTGNVTVLVNSLDDLRAGWGPKLRTKIGPKQEKDPKFIVKFSDYPHLADDHPLKLGNVSKPFSLQENKFSKVEFKIPHTGTKKSNSHSRVASQTLEVASDDGSLVLKKSKNKFPRRPKMDSVKIQEFKPYKEDDSQLKKYAHAANLNKLVEQYRPKDELVPIASNFTTMFPGPNLSESSSSKSNESSDPDQPLIVDNKTHTVMPEGCGSRDVTPRPRLMGVKTSKDGPNSVENEEEAKILKDLFEDWYKTVKEKLEKTKKKSQMPTLTLAYNNVINRLDHISETIIGRLNKTSNFFWSRREILVFDENDYPEKDAVISNRLCTPTAIDLETNLNKTNETQEWMPFENVKPEEIEYEKNYGIKSSDRWKEDPLAPKAPITGEIHELLSDWSTDQFAKDLEAFDDKMKSFKSELEPFKVPFIYRNLDFQKHFTPCDHYLRCKHQMHVSLDKCNRLDQEKDNDTAILNAETVLSLKRDPCNGNNSQDMQELYELIIERNGKIRKCLNDVESSSSNSTSGLCESLKSSKSLTDMLVQKVFESNYENSADCYNDVNFIIERCESLRSCCPDFDRCRDQTLEPQKERDIMVKTALVNQQMFDCLNSDIDASSLKNSTDLSTEKDPKEKRQKKNYIVDLNLDPETDLIDKWFPLPKSDV